MAFRVGNEFNFVAGASPELRRRQLYFEQTVERRKKIRKAEQENGTEEFLVEFFLSELARRLADPAYAALYYQISDQIDHGYKAVAAARNDLEGRREQASRDLIEMQQDAARLEDGTRVYRRADGVWMTEEGRELSPAEATGVAIPDEPPPTWEDYGETRNREESVESRLEEVEKYESEVLDPAKGRLEDENNPPSMEELEEIKKNLESRRPSFLAEFRSGNEHIIAERANLGRSVADEFVPEGRIDAPDINRSFKLASEPLDVPDLDLPLRPDLSAPTAP